MAQEAKSLAQAIDDGTLQTANDVAKVVGYYNAPSTSINCKIAQSFTAGFKIYGGAQGITLGILALAGIPPMALALPAAVSLEMLLVAGGGLIAIGAELGPDGASHVSAGLNLVDSAFKQALNKLVSVMTPEGSVATSVKLWHIIQNVKKLKEGIELVKNPPVIPVTLAGLSCPTVLQVGTSGTCTVSLTASQLGPTSIGLNSSAPAVAGVPSTVSVPAGSATTIFTVTAGQSSGSATITAGPLNGSTRTATVAVTGLVTLGNLTCSSTLQIGQIGSCTLSLSAAQNSQVTIPVSTTNAAVLFVPNSIVVPANQVSFTFPVTGTAEGFANVIAGPLNEIFSNVITVVTPISPISLQITSASCELLDPSFSLVTITGTVTGPIGTHFTEPLGGFSCQWPFCTRGSNDPPSSTWEFGRGLNLPQGAVIDYLIVAKADIFDGEKFIEITGTAGTSVTCPSIF